MLAGEVYDACDPELLEDLNRVKVLCQQYNNLLPTDFAARNKLIREILGQADEDTFINQPFYCDYGKHIRVGKRFFANFGLTILDEAYVTIGDDCFLGPHVQIYCACHSTDPRERKTRQEWAKPVTIGNDVWIGGNVTILPGVTIGDNCTIGAGSVVTHDIPANSIAVGNPARVIKTVMTLKHIYLAGGCFWGTEHFFKQIDGVVETEVGFANGLIDNPTYEQVYTDTTGYAETVHVIYDPNKVSLEFLLHMFFVAIDPTSLNKQGHDEGTRYRTGIYYTDSEDMQTIDKVYADEQSKFAQSLVVEKLPLQNFYPADEYHQDYLDKHPNGYCHLPKALFDFARKAKDKK